MLDSASQAIVTRDARQASHQRLLTWFVKLYGRAKEQIFAAPQFPDIKPKAAPECDCIAITTKDGLSLAIEHTELEVLKGKNENDKLFLKYFQNRDSELQLFNFDLQVIIEGSELIKDKKLDWHKVSNALVDYLRVNADSFEFNNSKIITQLDIPFSFHIYKTEATGNGKLDFRRFDSPEFRNKSLYTAIQKALSENQKKFNKYSQSQYRRILLMENKDVQITNERLIYEIYLRVTNGKLPEGYDEVWLCWTLLEASGPTYQFICFDGDAQVAAKANELFEVGPHYKEWWWKAIQTNANHLPTLKKSLFSQTEEKLAKLASFNS